MEWLMKIIDFICNKYVCEVIQGEVNFDLDYVLLNIRDLDRQYNVLKYSGLIFVIWVNKLRNNCYGKLFWLGGCLLLLVVV